MAITAGRASQTYQTVSDSSYETAFQADSTRTPGVTASTHGSAARGIKVWCAGGQDLLVRITGIHDRGAGGTTLDVFRLDNGSSQEFLTSGRNGITKLEIKAATAGATAKWTVTVQ